MRLRLDRLRLAAVVLTGLFAAVGHAAEWQLADLMQSLAQTQNGQAHFVEKKYISMIDQPVESSGELYFSAPDKLEKRTLKPRQESLVLDGTHLTLKRTGKPNLNLELADTPQAAAFVESIRGTLTGNRAALEKLFHLTLDGTAERWQLSLRPKEVSMSRAVTRIRVAGSRGEVRQVDYELADGDRAEMRITPVLAP